MKERVIRKIRKLIYGDKATTDRDVLYPKDSPFVPDGHFYSPIPDRSQFPKDHSVFKQDIQDIPGIELNHDAQFRLLRDLTTIWGNKEKELTANPISSTRRFNLNQDFFREADMLALYGILQLFKPLRIIEVGSGHSSAVMLDATDESTSWKTDLTFIEPFPDRLMSVLSDKDHRTVKLIQSVVQAVPVSKFLELGEDDLLFIDSSHVSKIGSDVNYLFFEILPRLNRGVIVHIHDIFYPFEYPFDWIQEGRSWNESYLLRAFLTDNPRFEILLWNSWLGIKEAAWIQEHSPLFMKNTGGSIYLRKK
jgi:predicted O-methyltransferase YrrM